MNTDGSSETVLSFTEAHLESGTLHDPAWSPDGTLIAFAGVDSARGADQIYTGPAAGGAATERSSLANAYGQPRWSPNSTTLAYTINAGSIDEIGILDIRATDTDDVITTPPASTSFVSPCYSPDGNSVAFQSIASSQYGIDTQIVSSPASLTPIITYSGTQVPDTPYWSPYFGAKAFIGSGGEMTTAAGFIWAQVGDAFGSFASFAATTAAQLTITQQNAGTTQGPFVFLAKADKITKIVYSNSYFGAYNAVTPTNSKQALITLSNTTGQIDTVAPLAEPGLTRSARGGLAYDGKFVAIYDAHGKNLAPSGASHIELDKSGAVRSWR